MFLRPTKKSIAIAERAKQKLIEQAEFYPEGVVIESTDYGLTQEETAALIACGVVAPVSEK